jgi:hypothetical protein
MPIITATQEAEMGRGSRSKASIGKKLLKLWRLGLLNYLLRLAPNLDPPNLSLPNS